MERMRRTEGEVMDSSGPSDGRTATGQAAGGLGGGPGDDGQPGGDNEYDVLGFREYLPTPDEIVSARHFVHETLTAAGKDEDVIAASELVVDEFALNAMRHAGTFFSVSVEGAPGAVRIAVRDDSNAFPSVQEHVVLSISGRGLSIVASTAEQWGAQSLGRGKEVWAVLR